VNQVWKDQQYRAALAAAFFFWLVFLLITRRVPDWDWPLRSPILFLMPALVYPVLEELAFRGWLQSTLHQSPWARLHWRDITIANVLTSIAFASSHLVWHSSFWATMVFVPGLIFGYFRDRYQKILPCIALHIFYNCGFLWLFTKPQP